MHPIESATNANETVMEGHVEKTNDRDYEVEERYGYCSCSRHPLIIADAIVLWSRLRCVFRRNQRAILILYVVSRFQICGETFADLIAMTASQMRIAETIDAFYGDAGAKDGVSRSYKQAVVDLDAETIKALDGPYRYDVRNATSATY